jgi:hypothetical protein
MDIAAVVLVLLLGLLAGLVYWRAYRTGAGPVERQENDDRMTALEKDVAALKADVRGLKVSLDKIWCDITKAILELFEAIIERITK